MTRINLIDPRLLHRTHLIAEYRELPRIFGAANVGRVFSDTVNLVKRKDIPLEYTMGKGHVLFFYDKLLFLYNRQVALVDEMLRRGYRSSYDPKTLYQKAYDNKWLWNDYEPSDEAILINLERINTRLKEKGYDTIPEEDVLQSRRRQACA